MAKKPIQIATDTLNKMSDIIAEVTETFKKIREGK